MLPRSGSIFADVTERLAGGASLRDLLATRQEVAWDPAVGNPASRIRYTCDGRILRSPERDEPDPAPFGTDLDRERVKQAWNEAGFKPDRLADAVALEAGPDAFAGLTVLLLVPERALGGAFVLSLRDATDGVLGEERISSSQFVDAGNPLPDRWMDPAGPWADPVERAGRIAARVAATTEEGLYPVLVTLRDLPDDVRRVVIGWDRDAGNAKTFSAFYVVAAEGLFASEIRRHDWDSTTLDSRARGALERPHPGRG